MSTRSQFRRRLCLKGKLYDGTNTTKVNHSNNASEADRNNVAIG
jgi:hypothetical protein